MRTPWVVFVVLATTCLDARGHWSFTRIADTNTLVPGSSAPFQNFNIPSIGDGVVGFAGFATTGLTGPAGVYTGSGGALSIIADRQTPSPAGGTFLGFALGASVWPSMHAGAVAFNAGDGIEGGIFLRTGTTFTPVITTAMQLPNGGGATFNVIGQPSLESGRVAAIGLASPIGGPGGVYSWQAGALSVVADKSTPVPGAAGTFSEFFDCDLDQGSIIFSGRNAAGHHGLYRSDSGGLARLYDSATVVPGGNGGSFTGIAQAVQSAGHVAFYGQGGGQEGIYSDVSGTLQLIANRNTPMPGFPGLVFGGFSYALIDNGVVAFSAIDNSGGISGVFSTHTGSLGKVLASGDLLDGRIVGDVLAGSQGLDGNSMALVVTFTNGTSGIYMATIPAPGTLALGTMLAVAAARRRWRTPVC